MYRLMKNSVTLCIDRSTSRGPRSRSAGGRHVRDGPKRRSWRASGPGERRPLVVAHDAAVVISIARRVCCCPREAAGAIAGCVKTDKVKCDDRETAIGAVQASCRPRSSCLALWPARRTDVGATPMRSRLSFSKSKKLRNHANNDRRTLVARHR
jgi:hypothetical protein